MVRIRVEPKIDGVSGWFATSPDHDQTIGKNFEDNKDFDFVIIGAGFIGLSLAHRLCERQPDAKIAVIDALRVGEGTSGRNAGFIIDVPHNVDGGKTTPDHDRHLYALNKFAIKRLRDFKDHYAISCDWQESGKYMAARETRNLGNLDHFARQLKNDGFDYQDIAGDDLAKRLGTTYYQRAIYTPGNVLVNPAALIRGIAKALPPSVSLFEQTPVTEITYGSKHVIRTARGRITAKFIFEAGNIFNSEFGYEKHRLAPVYTYASLTKPLEASDVEKHFSNVKPWGITSAHPAGTTVRYTPDHRIFIRNILRFAPTLTTSKDDLDYALINHRRSFENRFPELSHIPFEFTWGGMIAVTLNQNYVFHKPAENIMVLNGCNGVGVAKGTYLGFYAADFISGDDNQEIRFIRENSHPSFIIPDPIRSLVARYRLKKEQAAAGGDL
ncbi:FAD-binding oxidoreductase [uncultured Bartonella sp.]|uniref:NAD(P)/FAD-dependent oxidoreductase n=1 Tax=uncultured Bartonella sp. TaxID=104108 RepID=UPI0025D58BCD|nr:FAD-binding oxidoreductase [uncultured Bartonella sp.]